MLQKNPAQVYKKASAQSATPGQLVLMLYDGLLRFLNQALIGLDDPDFIKSQELSHNNIMKAQAILLELQSTLDFEKGGELSNTLYRLYEYMLTELTKANTEKTKEPLNNVIRFAGEIRDTWVEMLTGQASAGL